MKHFYLINKSPRDKSGTVVSGHKTFESAQKVAVKIQEKTDGVFPHVIIESEKRFKKGQQITAGEY